MGFRFRKSFGGKNFRINISKSGIGYSYGIPGFTKTRLANGRSRTTASILGTGISYATETKGHMHSNNKGTSKSSQNYEMETLKDIDNIDEELFTQCSEEDFVNSIKKARIYYTWVFWLILLGIIFILGASPLGLVMLVVGIYIAYYFSKNLKVNVKYEITDDIQIYKDFKDVWLKINRCNKVWEIVGAENNENRKTHGGAGRTVDRKLTKFTEVKLPYLNIENEKLLQLKLRKKEVIFLQDKLIIFYGKNVACVDYKDLRLSFSDQKFIESEIVSKDAKIVDYTWEYVNKNGQPDKRYSNNRKLPICLYGKINISDMNNTFNIELQNL